MGHDSPLKWRHGLKQLAGRIVCFSKLTTYKTVQVEWFTQEVSLLNKPKAN